MAISKTEQTPVQRAKVNREVLTKLKLMLKDSPAEILGNLDAPSLCCRAGTVAIVKVDLASYPAPLKKPAAKKK